LKKKSRKLCWFFIHSWFSFFVKCCVLVYETRWGIIVMLLINQFNKGILEYQLSNIKSIFFLYRTTLCFSIYLLGKSLYIKNWKEINQTSEEKMFVFFLIGWNWNRSAESVWLLFNLFFQFDFFFSFSSCFNLNIYQSFINNDNKFWFKKSFSPFFMFFIERALYSRH
jgi:hypothetical protein